jgi:hypothetical protein
MENIKWFEKFPSIRHPTIFFYGRTDILIPQHRQYSLATAIFEPDSDPRLSSLDQLMARHESNIVELDMGHMAFTFDWNVTIDRPVDRLDDWFASLGVGMKKDKIE